VKEKREARKVGVGIMEREKSTHQNCHSGNLLTNGLNSSSPLCSPIPLCPPKPIPSPPSAESAVADSGPPSSISSARRSSWREGSNLGWRKARRRLRRYIAWPSIIVGGKGGTEEGGISAEREGRIA
jgi:hypothetical protein